MRLQIVYGRGGSGKSHFILQAIKDRLAQKIQDPIFLLVPEQFTVQAEKNLIQMLGTGGILKTEILSFKRMAHRVFNEVGGITFPHIHPAGKSILLSEILSKNAEKLEEFRKLLEKRGFIESVVQLLKEFKHYRVLPSHLREAAKSLPFGEKLNALALIYESYEQILKQRYRDAEDDLTILSKRLHESVQFQRAHIFVDEFSGFTPQELEVLLMLLKTGKAMTLSFCTDTCSLEEEDPVDVFYPVKKGLKRFLQSCKEQQVEILKPIHLAGDLPRFSKSPELAHLEKAFFSFPLNEYRQKTQKLQVNTALNIYHEVELAAQEIVRLCRDEGFRYREIGVVCRNLEPYQKLIEGIYSAYEIPYFIDQKKDIIENPFIRVLLSLFEILAGNWSYEKLFSYLKTGLLNVDPLDVDVLENYVLACGIKGSRWTMDGDWRHPVNILDVVKEDAQTEDFFERINRIRRIVVEPILDFSKKTSGKRTPEQFARALYAFIEETGVLQALEKWIEEFKEQKQWALAAEYTQILGMVMEALDQMVEVLPPAPMSRDDFYKNLAVGLSEFKVGIIPPAVDQVMIGSMERTRSHGVRALLVLGVNDGIFPSQSFEEGLLPDSDRHALRTKGIFLAEDTRQKAFDEQFLIYRTWVTPSEVLILSYSISDIEGKALRPSTLLARLKRIFPKLVVNTWMVEEKPFTWTDITVKRPTFERWMLHFRKEMEAKTRNPLFKEVFQWILARDAFKNQVEMFMQGILFENNPEPLPQGIAKQLYGFPIQSSISKLERYAACPFSYFVEYGLGAKERKRFQLSPMDIGNFLHLAVERFSIDLKKEGYTWKDWHEERTRKTIKNIVEELLDDYRRDGIRSFRIFSQLSRLERVIYRIVWLIHHQMKRGDFEVLGAEMVFGDLGTIPSVPIEVAGEKMVSLKGRIDRVDILEREEATYVRVVDYKSGTKKLDWTDIFHGLQVQLVVYLEAIINYQKQSNQKPVIPAGVFYLPMDDPFIRGDWVDQPENREEELLEKLKLKGFLIDDVDIVKAMDHEIASNSKIIPAMLKKDGTLGRFRYVNDEKFALLRNYVKVWLSDLLKRMQEGDVSVDPYKKKKKTPCETCSYKSVCQFDQSVGNAYRDLPAVDDESIVEQMKSFVEGKQEK